MKSRERQLTEGMELPNQDKIRAPEEKETYKYLGILEPDTIKQEMKEKIKKEYFRRTRNILKSKQYSRNVIKGINTWAINLVDTSIQRLYDDTEKCGEWLIIATRNNTDHMKTNWTTITRIEKYGEK